ncbi:MAG: TonB-dependent receptor domain-containing protein [Pyrinomonadaceae bacterium]
MRNNPLQITGKWKLLFFLVLFVFSASVFSQNNFGSLVGQVIDSQGDVIVGAEVKLVSNGKPIKETFTNSTGNYTFNNLPAGNYTVIVSKEGFSTLKFENILLKERATLVQNVELSVAVVKEEISVSDQENKLSNSASGDIRLNQEEIEAQLPDDDNALADALKTMAPAGPGEPQIYVDGFETTTVPPKQSIREIRISSNVFSAEQDTPSGSRIQIFTKSGTNKLEGSAFLNYSNRHFNARNPFSDIRLPYNYARYGGNLGGTLVPNRASFFLNFQQTNEDQTSVTSTQVVNNSFDIEPINIAVAVPRRSLSFAPRMDIQFNESHSFTARYDFSRYKITNLGVGEITLPERGYNYTSTEHLIQISDTALINSQTVNEFRFQFVNEKTTQQANNNQPSLDVLGVLLAGGSEYGQSWDDSRRFEFQNYVTTNYKKHLLRFGLRLRSIRLIDFSERNFNGMYSFVGGSAPILDENHNIIVDDNFQPKETAISSLERYRRTLLLQSLGFDPTEIRSRGGGAYQFSMSGGTPKQDAQQYEFGAFIQDEWRVKPNLNIYLGLRYENQTNLDDNLNFAPRFSFAWVPNFGKSQNMTIRAGAGVFYSRVVPSYRILLKRSTSGYQLITSDLGIVDLFPNIPSPEQLVDYRSQSTTIIPSDSLQTAVSNISLITVEQKVKNRTIYAGLTVYRTWHQLRQRNLNAPLPGTYIVGQPDSGVRPLGDLGRLMILESSNDYYQSQFFAGFRGNLFSNVSLNVSYLLSDTKDGGANGSFPSNSYDLRSDWGRSSSYGMTHRIYVSGSMNIPKLAVKVNPQIVLFSSRPFNITTGIDSNGDGILLDRPSFSNLPIRQNVYDTEFGVFDILPSIEDSIIPRNFGNGPPFFSLNLGVSRTFNLKFPHLERSKKASTSNNRYRLTVSLQIQNLFNKTNLATPIGVLTSPLFGRSTTTAGAYGFENGSPAYNRRIEFQARFSF